MINIINSLRPFYISNTKVKAGRDFKYTIFFFYDMLSGFDFRVILGAYTNKIYSFESHDKPLRHYVDTRYLQFYAQQFN